jgi:hypothetical protein
VKKFETYKSDKYIQTLSLDLVKEFIDSYWDKVMISTLDEDQVVHVIFKVEYQDTSIRSFSNMIAITNNHKCKQVLYDSIKFYILNNLSHYEQLEVKSILFSYILSDFNINHDSHTSLRTFINHNQIEVPDLIELSEATLENVKGYDFLPKTMCLRLWSPNTTFSNGYRQAYFVNDVHIFDFKIFSNHYNCIVKSTSNNLTLLKFKDTLSTDNLLPLNKLLKAISPSLNSFTRVIYKKGEDKLWNYEYIKYEYVDGILIGTEKRKIKPQFKINKRFPKLSKTPSKDV